jgi:chromosome segregation ATPase
MSGARVATSEGAEPHGASLDVPEFGDGSSSSDRSIPAWSEEDEPPRGDGGDSGSPTFPILSPRAALEHDIVEALKVKHKLEEEVEGLRKEADAVRADLEECSTRCDELQQEIPQLLRERDGINNVARELILKTSGLAHKKKMLEHRTARLQDENAALEKHELHLSVSVKRLSADAAGLEQRRVKLSTDVGLLDEILESRQHDAIDTTKNVESMQSTLARLKDESIALKRTIKMDREESNALTEASREEVHRMIPFAGTALNHVYRR